MILNKLYISNYKNIKDLQLSFSEPIICFVGENATGKTNILDAIYHLGLAKSYFNTTTSQNISFNADFFMIEGDFTKNNRQETIVCSAKVNQKRVLKKNGKQYEKISEHIGQFPVVIVSPYDTNLIYEGSEERRRFIDSIISQINPDYLSALVMYNKTLMQRNSYLKQTIVSKEINKDIMDIYDAQLHKFGSVIHGERKNFVENFTPLFVHMYGAISAEKESVSISYCSQLQSERLIDLLKENVEKDQNSGYTNFGTHKDDFIFEIQNNPIKKFGSQGQQKSFLTALKLTQFIIIKQKTKITPILLLDDIFDKLDPTRIKDLLKLVCGGEFGQVFLSDTDPERTKKIVCEVSSKYQIFKLPLC